MRRPAALPIRALPIRALLIRALLILVGVAVTGPPAAAAVRSAASPAAASSVVVVGVAGLRWDSVSPSRTPALWALASRGSLGALSVRSVGARTCAVDGWATLGAGNRARGLGAPPDRTCPPPPAERPAPLVLEAARRDNDRLEFDARVGALGDLLHRAGRCVTAVGPLTAYAVARPEYYLDDVTQVTAETFSRCPVTLVQAAGDDDLALAERLRRPGSVLLVVGIGEVSDEPVHLHVAAAEGPGFTHRELVSASTRRAPYVQLVDVAPTVLSLLSLGRPAYVTGQPWRAAGPPVVDTARTIADLVDLDSAAVAQGRLVPPFFALLVLGQALLYLLAALALRWLPRRRHRRCVLGTVRTVALAAAGAVAGTFLANLVPWWRADHPLAALLAAVAVADAALVAVALGGPWRRILLGQVGAVAVLTTLVLALDLVTGARLQMSSLAGYSPLVAGRFAGIGNVAYGVFATGALMATAVLAEGRSRRTVWLLVVVAGVSAVVVDGAPQWGSDFGGVLALVPAYAVLGMLLTGARVSLRRLLLALAAAVAVVGCFALLDYARPAADQTHLGRFVGQLLHGGATTVVRRKAEANLHLLTHSVLTLLVPLAVALLAGVLLRPAGGLRRAFQLAPAFRAGMVAVLVMGVVGFAVNDSGVAVPAMAGTVLLPLAIAVSVGALLHDSDRRHPAGRPPDGVPADGAAATG